MDKCLCDICQKNEAQHQFRVKRNKIVSHEFRKWGYLNIDICKPCFNKLMRIPADKTIEDEINKLIETDDWYKKYEDVDMQSAYLDGFQTVIDMLISQKILKM